MTSSISPLPKVFIWDFDGTLYQQNEDLWHDIREAEYHVIMNHTGWGHDKTVDEFSKMYKKIVLSATETVARLSSMPIALASVEMESYFDRTTYVKRDEKLIALFSSLKSYTHYILCNGAVVGVEKTLAMLGLPKETFIKIVTSEHVGANKPDPRGFEYIMHRAHQAISYQLSAASFLMIGDRPLVDLAPAKKLGMQTCLVWREKKPDEDFIDYAVPTVYDVVNVLKARP
ncbi:HAD family hydrolase [Candidatus Gottesmanbacteria bacterium]|nr:HAD family hydrolase [Candidatus Gottesmanbacteria bacterium]